MRLLISLIGVIFFVISNFTSKEKKGLKNGLLIAGGILILFSIVLKFL